MQGSCGKRLDSGPAAPLPMEGNPRRLDFETRQSGSNSGIRRSIEPPATMVFMETCAGGQVITSWFDNAYWEPTHGPLRGRTETDQSQERLPLHRAQDQGGE